MDDRRSYRRYPIWFPVTIVVDDGEVWAICRDVSAGGLLVSAVADVRVGTDVTLRFKIGAQQKASAEHVVSARVVRQQANADDLLLAFPYRLALELTAPITDVLNELEDAARSAT